MRRRGSRALLVSAALTACFLGLLAVILAHGRRPLGIDERLLTEALAARTAGGLRTARLLSSWGSGPVLVPMLLVVGLAAWRATGRRFAVVAPVLLLLAGQIVRGLLVAWVGRPRPPTPLHAVAAPGFAFPSGHTTSGTLGWGLAAVTLVLLVGRRRRSGRVPAAGVALAAVAAVIAVLVGGSRVYLGVHWGTDVLGGWLLGTALLALATLPLRRLLLPGRAWPARRG